MLRFLFPAIFIFQVAAAQSTVDSMVMKGIRLHDEGKYPEALALFEQVIEMDENNGLALYEAGNTHFALGNYKQAIKLADRVIKINLDAVSEAYVLKGNSFDMTDKPDKALSIYRDGLRRDPKSDLLHFNLGVTLLKQKKYEESAPEFISALKINPGYLSAHYMLGYSNAMQSQKTKTLLPLYYFLLLENKGQRAEVSFNFIKYTMSQGVEQPNKNVFSIEAPANMEDEFAHIDLLLSMIPVANSVSRTALKDSLGVSIPEESFSQKLVKYNESLFKILGETKQRSPDPFWWDLYVRFFTELQSKGHTEAFTNYILVNSGDKSALEWLRANKPKLTAFSDWVKEYQNRK